MLSEAMCRRVVKLQRTLDGEPAGYASGCSQQHVKSNGLCHACAGNVQHCRGCHHVLSGRIMPSRHANATGREYVKRRPVRKRGKAHAPATGGDTQDGDAEHDSNDDSDMHVDDCDVAAAAAGAGGASTHGGVDDESHATDADDGPTRQQYQGVPLHNAIPVAIPDLSARTHNNVNGKFKNARLLPVFKMEKSAKSTLVTALVKSVCRLFRDWCPVDSAGMWREVKRRVDKEFKLHQGEAFAEVRENPVVVSAAESLARMPPTSSEALAINAVLARAGSASYCAAHAMADRVRSGLHPTRRSGGAVLSNDYFKSSAVTGMRSGYKASRRRHRRLLMGVPVKLAVFPVRKSASAVWRLSKWLFRMDNTELRSWGSRVIPHQGKYFRIGARQRLRSIQKLFSEYTAEMKRADPPIPKRELLGYTSFRRAVNVLSSPMKKVAR